MAIGISSSYSEPGWEHSGLKISNSDLAQLRHLYTQLMRGTDNQKSMANGLLAPVIRNVERTAS